MGKKMNRGKQQVMLNYLPGRTFDFERTGLIAKVTSIHGIPNTNLNTRIVLYKISEVAHAWSESFRPILSDAILSDTTKFILIEPRSVQSELYPKVFWCQNRHCGRVFSYNETDNLPTSSTCPSCNSGRFVQLRHVKTHRCGAIEPLIPYCTNCHSSNNIALDMRGSERISGFRWICRTCGNSTQVLPGNCRQCTWSNSNTDLNRMSIDPHRAGKTYYPHYTVLINPPTNDLNSTFALREWPMLSAASLLRIPEIGNRKLMDFSTAQNQAMSVNNTEFTTTLDALLRQQTLGEITAEQFMIQLQEARQKQTQQSQTSSPNNIAQVLISKTGVPENVWMRAGQEMLEAEIMLHTGTSVDLTTISSQFSNATTIANSIGLSALSLKSDLPIITATFGYSRVEYHPNECRLNPFPPERDYRGKYPVYVNLLEADAIIVQLDPNRVYKWLVKNNYAPVLPMGTDPQLSLKGYFVQLFNDTPLYETIPGNNPQARLVFGLLHTMSHFFIQQAALLCGLDRTSLCEYILPRTLTFVIYSNNSSAATIGALVSLFEQSLCDWLTSIKNSRHCVYDPVCRDNEGSCHACTHLAETSCRFFNLNLGRAFLFGGRDIQLNNIRYGYFNPTI